MNKRELINTLAKNLQPVKVKKLDFTTFCKLILVFILSIFIGLAVSGIRMDLVYVWQNPRFILETLSLFILAVSTCTLAFSLSLPGRNTKALTFTASLTVGLWFLFLVYFFLIAERPAAGFGFSCIRDISIVAVLPALFIFFFIRSAVIFNPYKMGFITLLGAASFGAFATQFTCKNDDPLHVLAWHFLPILIMAFIGIYIGKKLLNKV